MCEDCYFAEIGEDGRLLCTCKSSEKLYKYVSHAFVCDEYETEQVHDWKHMTPFNYASKYYG